MHTDITILDNGNLELTVDEETAQELKERIAEQGDEVAILRELMEDHWTNGGYQPFSASDGNPFVGLTDAPCIAEAMIRDDHFCENLIEGHLWWYPNYAVSNCVEVLAEQLSVVFTLGDE